jgi:four helix bundle protein
MRTHKDLIVWQKSISFVTDIYQATKSFPKEELFGLTSQMRRAAISIPSNIAEGHGRHSKKELIRFLSISLGSASELETQLIISKNLDFISEDESNQLLSYNEEVIKMLVSLIKYNNNGKLEIDS